MSFLGRIILVAAGLGLAAINGIEHSAGIIDLIGGLIILVAIFAPRRHRDKPEGELQVHGSGNLIRWLLDNQLVDEVILLTYPVVVGQGTRLFPDTGPDAALDLVDSRATSDGITIQVYRPSGGPEYARGDS
jgi:hypothetical protein